jgi:hypothetical protein
MPVYDLSSGLNGLDKGIDSLGASLQAGNKRQLLQTLGAQLQSGDYDGAAATAFKSGDIDTGIAIQKMRQQQQASAQLANGLNAPATGAPGPAQDASGAPSQAQDATAGAPPTANASSPIDAYANAISSIESGGRYSALGPATASGDRAYGKYQVMGANIPTWTKQALGQELTPQQFIADPAAQDAVFAHRFGGYVRQTGNPQDAASMWFTGRPLAQGANAKDALGTSGQAYVNKFNAALAQAQPQQGQPPLAQAAAGAAGADPQAGASPGVAQGVIDKFQGDNPNDVGDETRLPDGSFRMDADPKGLAWAGENAGRYGLKPDPNDPSRFLVAGSAMVPTAPASAPPPAKQQALTAQLPQGAAAASTAQVDALPHGDPAKLDYYLRMQALATQSGNEGYAALFKQKAEIEKEALTPTTAQKNYGYYVRQELGAARAPLSFRDYNNGGSGPAAGTVSVRAGVPGTLAAPVTSGQAQGATAPTQGQPPTLAGQATAPQGRVLRLAPQDAARLPRGAHFVGVDGVTRVVR